MTEVSSTCSKTPFIRKEEDEDYLSIRKNKKLNLTLFNADEWRLNSIRKRSNLLLRVERAFDEALNKSYVKSNSPLTVKSYENNDSIRSTRSTATCLASNPNERWKASLTQHDHSSLNKAFLETNKRFDAVLQNLSNKNNTSGITKNNRKEEEEEEEEEEDKSDNNNNNNIDDRAHSNNNDDGPNNKVHNDNNNNNNKVHNDNNNNNNKVHNDNNNNKYEYNMSITPTKILKGPDVLNCILIPEKERKIVEPVKISFQPIESQYYRKENKNLQDTKNHLNGDIRNNGERDFHEPIPSISKSFVPSSLKKCGKKSAKNEDQVAIFLKWIEGHKDILSENQHLQLKEWVRTMKEWTGEDKVFLDMQCLWKTPATEASKALFGLDPHPTFVKDNVIYIGESDSEGRPHGFGNVTYPDGNKFQGNFERGKRNGKGITTLVTSSTMTSIEGLYVDDRLNGRGKILYSDGNVLYAHFCSGVLHGFSKLFNKDHVLLELCWYANGVKDGLIWKFLVGGSCLLGTARVMGHIAGDDVAYIYPDLKTVLLGTFLDNGKKMILTQTCFVQMAIKRKELFELRFTDPKGPYYRFDPGTTDQICNKKDALLPDPYEFQNVYVKTSKLKGAQEGLHAKRDLFKDEIVSFYNGIRMRADNLNCNSDDWELNAYKIMDLSGKDENGHEWVIDIPQEAISLRLYQASLSHKANHSFNPNAKFTLFDHPRFGLVPSIQITAEKVARDQEITVSYDYAMEEAPPWYQDLYTQKILEMYRQSRDFDGVLHT